MTEAELREMEARAVELDSKLNTAMAENDTMLAEMLLGEYEELSYEIDESYREMGL